MCGIAGFSTVADRAPEFREELSAAVDALRHRGPDDEGTWFDDGVGLGHRRLSILDLSPAGHQPMRSPTGRYVMVYNGEVYNFRDIRKELETKGRRCVTTGDSEVLLVALETWGVEETLRRLIGMFAIALWDTVEKRLILVRDRVGVKPLYYGWDGKSFCFGSELKAIRAFHNWNPTIDQTALAEYFQFGYVNAPRTIYRNVFKLLPGHWLELKQGGEPVVRRYWTVLDAVDEPLRGSEEELAEQLEALMVDAFRLRMVADVPVGMFLSGGIDSSAVTALLQKHHGNIHTFTIGFNESNYNEAAHARRVAEHLGTQHMERTLDIDEAKRVLPRWAELYDEPFADSSGVPTYLVSKMAGEQVKVALSADGGDELFSGYNIYGTMLRTQSMRDQIPRPLRAAVGACARSLPLDSLDAWAAANPSLAGQWRGQRPTWRLCRIRDWLGCKTPGDIYETALGNSWWGRESGGLVARSGPMREKADAYPGPFAQQMCLWDLHNYLPDDILAKVDRATMAASIEGREPLLDHRLVEFAFRLPLHMRRGALGPKHLLRKILYKYVPKEIVDRPKMGFAIPLAKWLRGDLSHLIDDLLDPKAVRAQGILDADVVAETVRKFRSSDDQMVNRVWSLLAFQLWRERWA